MSNFNRRWRMASYLQFLFFDLRNVSIITLVRESKKTDTKKLLGNFGQQVIKLFPFGGSKLPQTTYLHLR